MAIIELQNRIQTLEPQFLQALSEYLDFLIFQQEKKLQELGQAAKRPAKKAKAKVDEPEPERLRILRQYKGIAPKPHFPITKYDVYEQ